MEPGQRLAVHGVATIVDRSSARASGRLRKNAGVLGLRRGVGAVELDVRGPGLDPGPGQDVDQADAGPLGVAHRPALPADAGDVGREERPAVARALQDRRDRHPLQAFQVRQGQGQGAVDQAVDLAGPGGQGRGGRAEVAPDEEAVVRASGARSKAPTGVSASSGIDDRTIRPASAPSPAPADLDAHRDARAAAPRARNPRRLGSIMAAGHLSRRGLVRQGVSPSLRHPGRAGQATGRPDRDQSRGRRPRAPRSRLTRAKTLGSTLNSLMSCEGVQPRTSPAALRS